MSDSYFIRLGLTVRGPYRRSDLHELAARGGFSKSHEVSSDRKSWSSAVEHPDLFPAARRPGSEKSAARSDSEMRAADTSESHEKAITEGANERAVRPDRSQGADANSPGADLSAQASPLSPLTIWALVSGPLGFALLLLCTVLVVLTLRTSTFVPSQNIGLVILMNMTFLLGAAALTLGHLSIRRYQLQPGSLKERNLIVVGLSCGYTIVILCVLYAIVLLVSSVT